MGTNAGRSMLLSRSISRMPPSPLCVEGGISFDVCHCSRATDNQKLTASQSRSREDLLPSASWHGRRCDRPMTKKFATRLASAAADLIEAVQVLFADNRDGAHPLNRSKVLAVSGPARLVASWLPAPGDAPANEP